MEEIYKKLLISTYFLFPGRIYEEDGHVDTLYDKTNTVDCNHKSVVMGDER